MAPPSTFCGGTGKKSREHLWPQWTQKLVPADEGVFFNTKSTTSLEIATSIASHFPEERLQAQTDLANLQVHGIRAPCNEGWMSQIESETIPILTPMVLDQPRSFSVAEQAVLAKWITLRMIVRELLSRKHAAISHPQQKSFYGEQRPFDNSEIYIARLPVGNLRRELWTLWFALRGQEPAGGGNDCIAQYSVLQLGLFVAVFLYAPPGALKWFRFPRSLSHRFDIVFPAQRTPLDRPPAYSIDLTQLQQMYQVFDGWFALPARS